MHERLSTYSHRTRVEISHDTRSPVGHSEKEPARDKCFRQLNFGLHSARNELHTNPHRPSPELILSVYRDPPRALADGKNVQLSRDHNRLVSRGEQDIYRVKEPHGPPAEIRNKIFGRTGPQVSFNCVEGRKIYRGNF